MTRQTLRTAEDLVDRQLIAKDALSDVQAVAARYAVAIPPAMADLIDPNDPDDPIARQFVPRVEELHSHPDERADPIGDARYEVTPGLIHRYPDRVLLKVIGSCPVYCRFCFRREMVGPEFGTTLAQGEIEQALAYIRATSAIFEVIVSGGDPLVLSPRRISELTCALGEIPNVAVVRWHSRVPVVAPERVTGELVAALRASRLAVFVALHANHPRELTPAARAACARMIDAGIAMVSQSVLLKGVNDDVATLDALMRAFVANRIKPYYLHHADLAPGTGHFRTSIAEGQALMRALRGRLSGLAQPTYVLDIPGGSGKVPVGPTYTSDPNSDGTARIVDPRGGAHDYPPADDGGGAT